MGLDMYLSAEKYLSHYSYQDKVENESNKKQLAQFDSVLDIIGWQGIPSPNSPSMTISVTVGYWRKANAVHAWFVRECQDGRDECQKAYVDQDKLEELLAACQEVLASVQFGETVERTDSWTGKPFVERTITMLEPGALRTQSGFFFGSTEYDDWYVKDIEATVMLLDRVLNDKRLEGCDFYYQSSW